MKDKSIQEELLWGVQYQILRNHRKPSIEMAGEILKYLDEYGVLIMPTRERLVEE